MFKSSTIVYLGRDRIWAGGTIFKWDGKSLDTYLNKIIQKYKNKNLKLIVGEARSFVLAKNIPNSLKSDGIFAEAVKTIPENLSNRNFKWQAFANNEKGNTQAVEFMAVSESAVNSKLPAVPISKLIAHIFKDEKVPIFAIWRGFENVAVITFQGIVYLTSTSVGVKQGELLALLKQAKEEFNLDIKNIVTNWQELQSTVKLPKTFRFEVKNIDPMAEIGKIKSGEVENYSFHFNKESEKEEKPAIDADSIQEKPSNSTRWLLLFLFLVIAGASVFGYYYWKSQKAVDVDEPVLEQLPSVTPQSEVPESEIITEESEAIDFTDYAVEVQNGSGTAGAATTVSERLTEIGFIGVETSNADNFNYQGLTIVYKSDIPEVVLEELKNAFSDLEISEDNTLSLSEEYDVILIVGTN